MRVVVLTHLDLTELQTRTFGIYQRLRVLIEAAALAGRPLLVVFTAAATPGMTAVAHAQSARRSLAQVWGVEAEVECIHFAGQPDEPWILQQVKAALAYRWRPLMRSILHPAALDQLRRATAGASLLLVHRLPLMTALAQAGTNLANACFDLDDIEYLTLARHARTHPSPREQFFIRMGLPGVYLATWRAIRMARLTFVCSDLDRERLLRRDPSARISVLPNSVPLVEGLVPLPAKPVVTMVGVWSFRPNADGADYFIENSWPQIRREVPGAELWLVGSTPESLRSFAGAPEGVRFMGFVPDLAAVYGSTRLVVCPLRSGGGTRLKLLEAASYGRPIVSSAVGAEGIGFRPGEDALIHDDPAEVAQACVTVLRDEELASRLGVNARSLVARDYARPAVVSALATLLEGELAS